MTTTVRSRLTNTVSRDLSARLRRTTSSQTSRPNARSFDPVAIGKLECDAWAAYYRREWGPFLRAAVGMVGAGFGMGPRRTLTGAWYVLRANQVWAPYPDNDPDAAREQMRRFYALVAAQGYPMLDPVRAAELEVNWWRVHRAHQHAADPAVHDRPVDDVTVHDRPADDVTVHDRPVDDVTADDLTGDDLTAALVALYAYVYAVPPGRVREAARLRMLAMDASDRWVAAGCDRADPLLGQERRLLVASYTALRDAIDRS